MDKKFTRAPLKEIEQVLADESYKVGELAQIGLGSILQHPDFPEEYLEKFRQKQFSQKIFRLSFPLLIRRKEWSKTLPYYAEYLECNNKYYCLCSAWSEERHRDILKSWIAQHKIDLHELRKEWNLEQSLLPSTKRNKSTEVDPVAKKKTKGANVLWVVSLGNKDNSGEDVFKLITIRKTVLETIARQKRTCLFQIKVTKGYLVYTIDAEELDKAFWRDADYFTKNHADKDWMFFLNTLDGCLYSFRERIKFEWCRTRASKFKHKVSQYKEKALPSWVDAAPKPVHPVLPPLLSKKANKTKQEAKTSKAPIEKTKQKPNPIIEKEKRITPSEPLEQGLKDNGERVQNICLPTTELREKETRICRFIRANKELFRVSSEELLQTFKQRRISPVRYSEQVERQGEYWSFYLDVEQGTICKDPSGLQRMLTLKKSEDATEENCQDTRTNE